MTNGEAQLIAAVLTMAESARLGGVGAPLDPTTLKDKDVNAEVAIMFKEYLGYILAGNHPEGITDPQWQQGFPLIPEALGGDNVISHIISNLPPDFVTTILGAIAPLVAGNPALAGLLTTLGPLIAQILGGLGGGTTPPVTPPNPTLTPLLSTGMNTVTAPKP